MRTRVINFLAGPGAGKSTAATGVFSALKLLGRVAEYVPEYAKDLTWEEIPKLLENQLHVFAEQYRRQHRLRGKVEYIVTDSPLVLSSIYFDYHQAKMPGPPNVAFADSFKRLVMESFKQFENDVYFINRNKPYVPIGRPQSQDEAENLDTVIKDYLDRNGIYYHETTSDEAISDVLQDMLGEPFVGLQWALEARDVLKECWDPVHSEMAMADSLDRHNPFPYDESGDADRERVSSMADSLQNLLSRIKRLIPEEVAELEASRRNRLQGD